MANRTPAANGNGWNNTDVTVSFAGTDSLTGSGVSRCSPNVVLSAEGSGQSASGICTDVAGNNSAPASVTGINIDKSLPSVTIMTPPGGASYVSGAAVLASFGCGDVLSGVSSCVGTVANGAAIDTTGTRSKTFTVTAIDKAGNMASGSTTYLIIPAKDTGPVITPVVTGTLGDNGWYRSAVSITWQVADPDSPIKSEHGCGPSTLTYDTDGVTFTCSATSAGGTSSKAVTIKRDDDRPIIAILSPLKEIPYKRNAPLIAIFVCIDFRSGIAQCQGTVPVGARVDTSSVGTKSFTVDSRDKAGNVQSQTVQYTVH